MLKQYFIPCLIGFAALGPAARSYALPQDIVEKTERATALVLVTTEFGPASGSAFCFDAGGFFATNAHVVLPIEGRIQIVVHPGEKDQRVLNARVIGADAKTDLAILLAEDDPDPLTVLPLGDSDKLYPTQEITAFGYPFGEDLTLEKNSFPTVSVNSGKVTSLRKKNSGELDLVQIDAATNPGNSGGPIIDDTGQVVGLVEAGLPGSGINFAIPVARLKAMIAQPIIDVEPGFARWPQRTEPLAFTVAVTWLQHPITDYQVTFSLKQNENDLVPRQVTGQTTKGVWKTSIAPLAKGATPAGNAFNLPFVIYDIALSTPEGKTAATAEGLIAFTEAEDSTYVFPGRPAARGAARGAQAAGGGTGRGTRAGRGAAAAITINVTMDPLPIDAREIGPAGKAAGAEFRVVDYTERMPVGLSFTTDTAANSRSVFRDIGVEYTRVSKAAAANYITARDGYVMGGLNVEATANTINALQIIFIRLKPDGTLDPADTYTSDWVGYANPKPSIKTLGGKGEKIIGVTGFKSQVDQIDAIGLIEELPPGQSSHAQQTPMLAFPAQK